MAKHNKGAPDGVGKIKFRVIDFEMDGSDASLQESLKSLAAALSRPQTINPNRGLRYEPAPNKEDEEDVEGGEELESDAEVSDATPRVARRAAPAKKPPKVELLNVSFEGPPTLKDFAKSRDPQTETKKYLLIAYWFKHHGGVEDLEINHYFTAYRHLGWTTPKDLVAPIKDLRHKRRMWLVGGEAAGSTTISHVGEGIVLEMGSAGE